MAKSHREKIKKMTKNFNFDYDYENDSLFLYDSTSKSKGSVELDDFVVDFNSKGEIVGIEMLNASKFFENLEEQVITKEILKGIKECKIDIVTKNNFFVIKFMLLLEANRTVTTPLLVPTINEPSPALAEV